VSLLSPTQKTFLDRQKQNAQSSNQQGTSAGSYPTVGLFGNTNNNSKEPPPKPPSKERTLSSRTNYDDIPEDDNYEKIFGKKEPIQLSALVLNGKTLSDLPNFRGDDTQDVEDYFVQYETCFQKGYWGNDGALKAQDAETIENEKSVCLVGKLKGNAYNFWLTLTDDQKQTYSDAKKLITEAFKDNLKTESAKTMLQVMRQGDEESVRKFAARYIICFEKAYADCLKEAEKITKRDLFLKKLHKLIRIEVRKAYDLNKNLEKNNFKVLVDTASLIEMRQMEEDNLEKLEKIKINKCHDETTFNPPITFDFAHNSFWFTTFPNKLQNLELIPAKEVTLKTIQFGQKADTQSVTNAKSPEKSQLEQPNDPFLKLEIKQKEVEFSSKQGQSIQNNPMENSEEQRAHSWTHRAKQDQKPKYIIPFKRQ